MSNNNDTRHPFLKILLLDVSEFAGGAIGVLAIFAVILGVLNYFHILSLSSIYSPLSVLPKQETKLALPDTVRNLALQGLPLQPQTASKPSPTPTGFQYDAEKAKTLIINYIKDTIKPEFLPPKIEVKQGLSIDGRIEDIKYEFGSMFSANQSSFSANFHYKENSNSQNDFSIFIQPENVMQATATASLANSLLTSYFTNPYSISNCQTKGVLSYCENFQTLNEGKKGYGIVLANEKSKLKSIVFNCFIPKESKDYNTQQSCITP